jgi:hypothetical protein
VVGLDTFPRVEHLETRSSHLLDRKREPRRDRRLGRGELEEFEQVIEVTVVDLLRDEGPVRRENARDLGGDERLVPVHDQPERAAAERQPPARVGRGLALVVGGAFVLHDRDADRA